MRLDHLNLLVSNVARSRAFYTHLLPPHGLQLNRDFGDAAVGFGAGDYAEFALVLSEAPIQPIHVAFRVDSRSLVDELYAAAIQAGARDNGTPGLRPHYHPHYYAAFILDPDGHNVEFVCHEA